MYNNHIKHEYFELLLIKLRQVAYPLSGTNCMIEISSSSKKKREEFLKNKYVL